MECLEFYTCDDELWCKSGDYGNVRVTESSHEIIDEMNSIIKDCYPEAYSALKEHYKKSSANKMYFNYLVVKRFCKCNFGELDTLRKDLNNGAFNFERVKCPLRGECKLEGIVCSPKINSHISEAEDRVMELVFKGLSNEEIADKLYISINTVKSHIRAVYAKLLLKDRADFVRYAERRNMYDRD